MTDLLSRRMAPIVAGLAAPGTLVVLDFDGTLAPIVDDRTAAALPVRTRVLVSRLARLYPVAVLSGRAADDVRSRLEGAPVRWVVGSHGAEWPGEEREHGDLRRRVRTWRATLASRLNGVVGIELEVKPLSLAVHYRQARDQRTARARIRKAVNALDGASIILGKRVVNVVPIEAGDKGTALQRLIELAAAKRVLFVGDDVTDEAAFGARLRIPAVMVRVGLTRSTRATAWLRRRSDVDRLLQRLCDLRRGAPSRSRGGNRKSTAANLETPELGPALAFMQELWGLEQGLNRRSKDMLTRLGVTGPQRLVVRVVGQLGPISLAGLARVLRLHPSSVTRLVRRLETRRLIRRVPDPDDGRRFLLGLAPEGRRLERASSGTVETAIRSALSAANPGDVAVTRGVIALVTKRLSTFS